VAVRDERRAVLALTLLAVAGGVLRVVRTPRQPPGSAVFAPDLPGGDLARQAALSRRAAALAQPLQPGERVDVDRADAAELDRLPRVGRELARRIVEERAARGPFGGLEGLRRVAGVGPAMLRALERTAAFSGVPRVGVDAGSRDTGARIPPLAGRGTPEAACGSGPVALNAATAAQLDCLPGVGPSLAGRIIADREARGPYDRVDDLDRVPGVGKRLVERLRPLLRAP
jgi:competence ComEA-like helix-hairpin-helix protein